MSKPPAQDLVAVAETTNQPICAIWGSPVTNGEPAYDALLSSSKVITFRTFDNCVGATRAYFDYHAFADRYRSPFAKPVLRPSKTRPPALPDNSTLSEHESKQLLAAYGIAVTREEVVTSASAAVKAAAALGYPVVLKASSAALTHKSDRGLVHVGLASAKAVRDRYPEIAPHSDGAVLVSEMVQGGNECVVGVTQDELFGPVVMFGLGGVFVEVF